MEVRRGGQFRELERVDPLHRAGEVREYLEAVHVADDMEPRPGGWLGRVLAKNSQRTPPAPRALGVSC